MEIKKFEKLKITERIGLSTYIIAILFIIINSILSYLEIISDIDRLFIAEIILAIISIISFTLALIFGIYYISAFGYILFIVYAFLDFFSVSKQYFFGISLFLNITNFFNILGLMAMVVGKEEGTNDENDDCDDCDDCC